MPMNLKEIQDNAPDGATHFAQPYVGEKVYFKKESGLIFFFDKFENRWNLPNGTYLFIFKEHAQPLYPTQEPKDPTNPSHYKQGNSHYFIDVSNFKEIDFYVIARLYGITDPNIQHVIKKLLAVGKRNGGKSAKQDIQECIDSLNRKLEIDKLLEKLR
jgi:hypothetical protein